MIFLVITSLALEILAVAGVGKWIMQFFILTSKISRYVYYKNVFTVIKSNVKFSGQAAKSITVVFT